MLIVPPAPDIDQVKVQEVVMVVAAVLVAMAVKVCVVLLPAIAVELEGDMVT